MKWLNSLLHKIRLAIVKRRLAMVDNRQRRTVAEMTFAVDCRMQAQQEFAARSVYNARCKRVLLEKLAALQGDRT